MAGDKPHYHGHRARFRERVRTHGAETLADYELLEGLLFGAKPQGDTKPLAKDLLDRFGSLNGVLTASPGELESVPGVKDAAITLFKLTREASRRLVREEVIDRPVISSWDKLLEYCRAAIGHETSERFHLLFLDKKNVLIADETQQRGTVDHTPVYPREVVKRALELGASALILVHNHPSGDPTPSRADIVMTLEVQEAAGKLGIAVHDHIVITRSSHASFRALGLL